jgi:hypothetical protein
MYNFVNNSFSLVNSYLCKVPEELLKKNGHRIPNFANQHLKIRENNKTMFLLPVTESEVEKVANNLIIKLCFYSQ